jgi:hypothetical protein
MEIVASTGQLQCDSPTAAEKHGLSDHKVSTNVEIMTISSKKMKSRLRTMRMLVNSLCWSGAGLEWIVSTYRVSLWRLGRQTVKQVMSCLIRKSLRWVR